MAEKNVAGKKDQITYAYDLNPDLYLYEWLLNVVCVAMDNIKENKRTLSIRKGIPSELALHVLKEVIEEYRRNILALNPDISWWEFLDLTRNYLYKKATGGIDPWQMKNKAS